MAQDLNQLAQCIDGITQHYPFAVHWDVREIASGQHISQGGEQVIGAFSTRKVSVLLACLALVHVQKLSLDDTYPIDASLKDGVQAGVMRNLSAGIELSLRDHLAQMMITSDNICTQLVFRAMEEATGDALQWVNDYCAQLGMYHTLHREVFPRSAELAWSHPIDAMTVTSATDQALLLEHLAHGAMDDEHAKKLRLTTELCQLALELMSHIYTPLLGAYVTQGRFVEKNGRGIRGLSQVGILLDHQNQPVASVAVFAESVPVELFDGTPGRVRAMECFAAIGQVVEQTFLDGTPVPIVHRQVIESDFWEQELGELLFAVEGGRAVNADVEFTFSGIGKIFFAQAVVEAAGTNPELLQRVIPIRAQHREHAETGTLRHLPGELKLTVDDAMRLVTGSGDGAAVQALFEYFEAEGIDILECGRQAVAHLPNTTITGLEKLSAGEGFHGVTTANDVLVLLRQIINDDGPVMEWMSQVFEPGGLASTLPGYGPHTIQHWTVAGWERMYGCRLDEGRSSLMILKCPKGFTGMVAHAPIGTHDVPAKFGSLGLSTLANT
ncbi:serine hydrolase [Enteractinococcus fodinae]|uniref:Beta-lactamase class A n=1 Tax=Enteractinococcus fodinae TaxID=684663 RepID=A0ABU2AX61_9MICC|nr:serine hydrolase [Enteractinococcus fodinae]MDR7345927.1 beta-lactamase class A [Enteractinococcus fodinae]